MLWFILALLSAIFDSIRDIASKKSLQNVEPKLAALANTLFAFPIMLFAAIAFEKPVFDNTFWIVTAIHSAILALAMFLYMKSLKMGDLSIAIPFTALSPVFMIFIAPLAIGEYTSAAGTFGVILIAIGAYVLNLRKISEGILEPVRALIRDKGVVLMVLVSFLWSITSIIDRIALRHSTPLFYVSMDFLFVSTILFANAFKMRAVIYRQAKENIVSLAFIGMFFALAGIMYIYAYKLTLAAYVISIKRTSILFSVLFGGMIFKEKNIRARLLGAAFIVSGAVIILIA